MDGVLEMLAAGASPYQVELDFPGLAAEDVRACIAYARERLGGGAEEGSVIR